MLFRKLLNKAVVSAALLLSLNASAGLITFEEGSYDPFFNYYRAGVFDGTTISYQNSGYRMLADNSADDWVLFSFGFGDSTGFMELTGASGIFSLNSFDIIGAWGSQNVTVQGLNLSDVLYEINVNIDTDAVDSLDLNWSGITSFRIFHNGSSFIPDTNITTDCQACYHVAIDNIKVNESINNQAEVPEPSTLAILGLGIIGLGFRRTKH